MNSDSPVSSRLPAPISAPRKPPCACFEPSPKMVSISIPSSMYIMPPASATVASFGIQLDFDELHVVAENLVVDLVHVGHADVLLDGEGASPLDIVGAPGQALRGPSCREAVGASRPALDFMGFPRLSDP